MPSSRALIASLAALLSAGLCASEAFAGPCLDGKASSTGLIRDLGIGSPIFFEGNYKQIVTGTRSISYFAQISMGNTGDMAVSGQWVARGSASWPTPGPGPDTIGLYRPSNNNFYLSDANPLAPSFDDPDPVAPAVEFDQFRWGIPSDLPVAGNWDGDSDGTDEVGIWRPSETNFYLATQNGSGATLGQLITMGEAIDTPLAGNFDDVPGDEVGVARPKFNYLIFYLRQGDGTVVEQHLGQSGDQALVGDWDGNGRDTPGVYRPENGNFYLTNQEEPGAVGVDIQFDAGDSSDWAMPGGWWGNCPAP